MTTLRKACAVAFDAVVSIGAIALIAAFALYMGSMVFLWGWRAIQWL